MLLPAFGFILLISIHSYSALVVTIHAKMLPDNIYTQLS